MTIENIPMFIVGCMMILLLFGALFVAMALDIGIKAATKIYAGMIGVVMFIAVAVFMIGYGLHGD